eukprot:TRINITY_DN31039_c0_g1_i1.p1 TRINITY_DN31039_c0_g1~~TRINITY_DN31039_c0_g1_i1.p1  ORF type:complete len:254 (+),score=57.15 TRINITY_DN31039_c0_g1_i1:95-856(+)
MAGKGGALRREREAAERVRQHLMDDLWCRIGVSKVHGVGLIALRDIPAGTCVDHVPCQLDPGRRAHFERLALPVSMLKGLEPDVQLYIRQLYSAHHSAEFGEQVVEVPTFGVNAVLSLTHFVNHPPAGHRPNARMFESVPARSAPRTEGFSEFWRLVTTRPVAAGEEIWVDYNDYLQEQLPGMGDLAASAKVEDAPNPLGKKLNQAWDQLQAAPSEACAAAVVQQLVKRFGMGVLPQDAKQGPGRPKRRREQS